MSKLLLPAFLVLLFNSAYLAAFADPTVFYMGNVLVHILLGLLLIIPFLLWLRKNFSNLSFASRMGAGLLIVGAIIGAILTWTGAYRPYRF
ncbi:MAG TPA: hypothetical protein VFG11_02485, partial [Acidobacteriota bacterium]|nr:hypothetical protein [Acidobacteriota bacterium]